MTSKWITRKELADMLEVDVPFIERNRKSLGLPLFEYRINKRVIRYEREPLIEHLKLIKAIP